MSIMRDNNVPMSKAYVCLEFGCFASTPQSLTGGCRLQLTEASGILLCKMSFSI
jgi:hypothetical protein